MKISLCICTRNRPQDLAKALASVYKSLLLPTQIIVSDDSDDLQAAQTQAACAAVLGITYIRGPRRGLSANRNCCLDFLADDIEAVAYIDDDVVVRPEFLREAANALAAAPLKTIVTGRENKNGVEITPHNCSFWGHQEVPPQGEQDYHTVVINTALFPRKLFEGARFDEALKYGSEEADICAQAEAFGYRIRFCPHLVNDHYPSPINRTEYAQVVEASRLYSTYKRYRWLERNPHKAGMYALLAPLHILAGVIKTGRLNNVPVTVGSICTAFHLTQSASRTIDRPL